MLRSLLLALLIVLLPVRGWVGDAMAGQMLAQQLSAIHSVAHNDQLALTSGHFDDETAVQGSALPCADHAAADPQHPPGKSCAGCTSCDVCHTVALTPFTLPAPGADAPHAPPHTTAWRPASAEATRQDKPPIG